jgi:hypothetical protein
MSVREIQWEIVDWIHLAAIKDKWWALVTTVRSLQVP